MPDVDLLSESFNSSAYAMNSSDDTGKISLSAQQEIAEQYITVEQCKRDVAEKLDALAHQKIEL